PADPRRLDGDGAHRRADRRHHLLADLGATGARVAPGQRDPARRGVPGATRPDPRAGARAGQEPDREAEWPEALLPPLPAGSAGDTRGRLLDGLARPRRAGEVAERRPD